MSLEGESVITSVRPVHESQLTIWCHYVASNEWALGCGRIILNYHDAGGLRVSATCPKGHENSEGSLFCNICGTPIEKVDTRENAGAEGEGTTPPKSGNLPLIFGILGLVIVLIGALVFEGVASNRATTQEPVQQTKTESVPLEKPNIPVGYKDVGNGFAIKWADVGCSTGSRCWQIALFAYNGCASGGYIEANFLDSAGTVVDWTNDTIPRLGIGDTYNSSLSTSESGVESIKITQLTC